MPPRTGWKPVPQFSSQAAKILNVSATDIAQRVTDPGAPSAGCPVCRHSIEYPDVNTSGGGCLAWICRGSKTGGAWVFLCAGEGFPFDMSRHSTRTRRRKAIVAGVILLAVAMVATAAIYGRYFGAPKRFAVVQADVLYRSAQPTTGQIGHLIDEIGLRTVLIVREGSSRRIPDEVSYARGRGIDVVHIPIKSRQPVPDDQIEIFFRCVDSADSRPVLIHCSAGRHRTGYLCALYRIERQGWTVQQAIDEMLSFGFNTESQAKVLEQLRNYKPGRWRVAIPTAAASDASGSPTLP